MKVHGFHWLDNVLIRLSENGAGSVIAINHLEGGMLWTFSVAINLHELDGGEVGELIPVDEPEVNNKLSGTERK